MAVPTSSPFAALEDTFTRVLGFSVSDADAGASAVEVTVAAQAGLVSLSALSPAVASALTFTVGNAGGSVPRLRFRGNQTQASAALAALGYTSAPNWNSLRSGWDMLTVTVNDLGNSGTGGPREVTAAVPVLVTAVNDAPVISAPPSVSAIEACHFVVQAPGVSGELMCPPPPLPSPAPPAPVI